MADAQIAMDQRTAAGSVGAGSGGKRKKKKGKGKKKGRR